MRPPTAAWDAELINHEQGLAEKSFQGFHFLSPCSRPLSEIREIKLELRGGFGRQRGELLLTLVPENLGAFLRNNDLESPSASRSAVTMCNRYAPLAKLPKVLNSVRVHDERTIVGSQTRFPHLSSCFLSSSTAFLRSLPVTCPLPQIRSLLPSPLAFRARQALGIRDEDRPRSSYPFTMSLVHRCSDRQNRSRNDIPFSLMRLSRAYDPFASPL